MIALAAFLLVQPQTLTGDFGVMRLDLLVKEMAARTGWTLAPAPSLKNDYVYANVRDLTKEDAKKALASMVGGKWTAKAGLEELSAPPPGLDEEEAWGRRCVEAFFKTEPSSSGAFTMQEAKGLIEAYEAPQKQGWQADAKIMDATPMKRGLRALAVSLGRRLWLDLKPGQRIVFAMEPTSMQAALPPAARQAAQQMMQDCQTMAKALPLYSQKVQARSSSPLADACPSLPESFGESLLVASSSEGCRSLAVKVVRPGQGPYAAVDQVSLTDRHPGDSSLDQVEEEPFSVENGGEKIPLSEAGQKAAVLMELRPSLPPSRLGTDALEALTQPEKRDILDLLLREPLDRLTERTGHGLISLVPDSAILNCWPSPLTYSRLINALYGSHDAGGGTAAIQLGQNTAAVLKSPSVFRRPRFNRQAMAALTKGLLGEAPLAEVMADYCLSDPGPASDQAARQLLAGPGPRSFPMLDDRAKAVLRIYGRLPAPLKKQAAAEGTILAAGSLPPASRQDLLRLAYAENSKARPSEEAEAPRNPDAPDEGPFADPFRTLRYDSSSSAAADEPTRTLGRGIPAQASVAIRMSSEPVWFGRNKDMSPSDESEPVFLERLAEALVLKEAEPRTSPFGWCDSFQLVQSSGVVLTLSLPEGIRVVQAAVINDAGASQELTLESLPPEARQAVDQALARARKTVHPRPSGSQNRPPQAPPQALY